MTLSLAFLTPDFLVVDAVRENLSTEIFPANREKNWELFNFRPISRRSPLDLLVISWGCEQIP
jgi:hypothetical protein